MPKVTDGMVEAFGTAWASTAMGVPGARTRAGLEAALAARLPSDSAKDHLDPELSVLPLYGRVEYVEHVADGVGVLHMCRDDKGDLVLMIDDEPYLELDENDCRWLAGALVAALDNWPRT